MYIAAVAITINYEMLGYYTTYKNCQTDCTVNTCTE